MPDFARTIRQTTVAVTQGDITRQDVTAIVNAANSSLMGGGGVDGAIHRAGGPAILEECKQIRAIQGQCAPGEAVITCGGNLKAKYVIHTVGPIWRGGSTNESTVLKSAYQNSLQLGVDNEVSTIAFPSISTGAYGYPLQEAAQIATTTVSDFIANMAGQETLQEIRFVLFDTRTFDAYKDALESLN